MPELPEVETTLRGIESHIINKTITSVVVRNPSLRWPVPVKKIKKELENKKIDRIYRRGKYLLLESHGQYLIIHLGMSGSLRITDTDELKKQVLEELLPIATRGDSFYVNGDMKDRTQ